MKKYTSLIIPALLTLVTACGGGGGGGGGGSPAPVSCFTTQVVESGVSLSIVGYTCADESVTVPSTINGLSVVQIGASAFESKGLTSVTIPSGVTSIGSGAFANNVSLTNVTVEAITPPTIPDSSVFNGTPIESGTAIGVLADSVSSYEAAAGWSSFTYRPTSTAVTCFTTQVVESGVSVSIVGYTCTDESIVISPTINRLAVVKIDDSAFESKSLTSVTIPSSVRDIGDSAFADNQLTSVTIPSSVRDISTSAFARNQLTSVTIPSSVTNIGDSAFENNQLTSVTIPDSVTSIGSGAFFDNQLTSVTIPDSVTSIGSAAFADNQLTSVIIPNSVTRIDDGAFLNNDSLTNLTVEANNPPALNGENTFGGTPIASGTAIFVPASSLAAYRSALGWSDFTFTAIP